MAKKNEKLFKGQNLIKKNWLWLAFFFLLGIHLFFRFYQMEMRNLFSWDQVDNAWAAKNIIVDHQRPLLGMQAKFNAGVFIGPLYYYLIAPIYFLTGLDPIASGIMAGLTSVFTFLIIYFLTKKLFSPQVALLTVFFYSFSSFIISQDRIQWPVNLIAPISLIIFYALYQVINGKLDYLFILSAALGFSFHLNFTSIFFPMIVLCALPLFPWSKKLLKYSLVSLPVFLIWLGPNLLAEFRKQSATVFNLVNYLQTYYHGFHFRRVFQVARDAFIEFEGILIERLEFMRVVKPVKYLLLPIFILTFFISKPSRERFVFCYLIGLWFLIPWFVFSLYSGEITNYYFSLTRPMALMIIAYLLVRLFEIKNIVPKVIVIAFLAYYSLVNTQNFFRIKSHGLDHLRKEILNRIEKGEKIEFKHGFSESYLYYFYTEKWK